MAQFISVRLKSIDFKTCDLKELRSAAVSYNLVRQGQTYCGACGVELEPLEQGPDDLDIPDEAASLLHELVTKLGFSITSTADIAPFRESAGDKIRGAHGVVSLKSRNQADLRSHIEWFEREKTKTQSYQASPVRIFNQVLESDADRAVRDAVAAIVASAELSSDLGRLRLASTLQIAKLEITTLSCRAQFPQRHFLRFECKVEIKDSNRSRFSRAPKYERVVRGELSWDAPFAMHIEALKKARVELHQITDLTQRSQDLLSRSREILSGSCNVSQHVQDSLREATAKLAQMMARKEEAERHVAEMTAKIQALAELERRKIAALPERIHCAHDAV